MQFNPRLGVRPEDLRENVEALACRFEEAAEQGAKIIVAPEMATTGYQFINRADIAGVTETIPGPTTRRFAKISRRYDCYIVWGMPERDRQTDLYYNSAAIVGPEGYVGKYRKTHLWESEAHWAGWGDRGVPVFQTEYGGIALLICQDANYVETFRLAALQGANLVCFATNSSGQTVGHLQARAIQNGLYIVSANRTGSEIDRYSGDSFEMKGCSAIWSPVGSKLAEASLNEEATVYADIDPGLFRTRIKRLSERRPQTYKALARHVAPWNLRASKDSRRIEAVAVQYRPLPGDLTENRKQIERMLAERLTVCGSASPSTNGVVETPPARLIVLPELSLVGRVTAERMHRLSEEFDGPTVSWAAELAQRYGAFVVCGLPERAGEQFFNSVVAVNPQGKQIAHTRKIHLNEEDHQWASAGDRWNVFQTEELGRLGLLVGSDSYVAESGTIMAIQRADVVAIPASWQGQIAGDGAIAINPKINPHAKRNAMVLWDEMAWGQQFYAVVANASSNDDEPGGRSGIYSPDPIYDIESPALACTDKNEVVVGHFLTLYGGDPDHWIDQSLYVGSRRPDSLYYPLLAPSKARRFSEPEAEPAPAALAP